MIVQACLPTPCHSAREAAKATVDVLIPVYNCASTVESAIASIQAQTVADIRIVVVNDGSIDSTRQVVERLQAQDSRIVLVDRENGGVVDALNTGLSVCTADIVARHDGDDLAEPHRLETQLAFLRDNPDCIAVSGATQHIDGYGRRIGPVLRLRSPDLSDPELYPQREPYLMHPFLMVRRCAIQEIGGYRHVFHAEDTDLYWRLQERGRLYNMPDLLGSYRMHDESVTSVSIVNGRVAAVSSQLAGISALRRRAGRPDVAFPRAALAEYQKASSLGAMIAAASLGLEPAEAARLMAAACAKLLETSSYRSYELEEDDCSFIGANLLKALPGMPYGSRVACIRMLSGTAARLIVAGNVLGAWRLVPPQLFHLVAARVAFRTLAPPRLRRAIRQAARRRG